MRRRTTSQGCDHVAVAAGREASSGVGAFVYERHRPERTLLYPLVEQHFTAFEAHLAALGTDLPACVEQEFEDYLKCGRLEHDFLRVRCGSCPAEHLVALSCRFDVRAVVLPIMETLRDRLGETVNLTVREGDQVVYIETATPNRMIRVQQLVGARPPLHVTAVGKLMRAAAGEEGIRAYAQRTNLPAYTRNTIGDLPRLVAECTDALDDEEAEIDTGCIGVLLHDATGDVIGGLSVSAPIARRRLAWVPEVLAAVAEISAELGYSLPGT